MKSRKYFSRKRKWYYNILQYVLFFFAGFYTKDNIYKFQMQLVHHSNNTVSNLMSCIIWPDWILKNFYEKSDIIDVIDWKFEDGIFKVPKAYDKILKNDFGNYMELPPEKDRVPHHFYKIFKKDDK